MLLHAACVSPHLHLQWTVIKGKQLSQKVNVSLHIRLAIPTLHAAKIKKDNQELRDANSFCCKIL